jgi:hypothetical protein
MAKRLLGVCIGLRGLAMCPSSGLTGTWWSRDSRRRSDRRVHSVSDSVRSSVGAVVDASVGAVEAESPQGRAPVSNEAGVEPRDSPTDQTGGGRGSVRARVVPPLLDVAAMTLFSVGAFTQNTAVRSAGPVAVGLAGAWQTAHAVRASVSTGAGRSDHVANVLRGVGGGLRMGGAAVYAAGVASDSDQLVGTGIAVGAAGVMVGCVGPEAWTYLNARGTSEVEIPLDAVARLAAGPEASEASASASVGGPPSSIAVAASSRISGSSSTLVEGASGLPVVQQPAPAARRPGR